MHTKSAAKRLRQSNERQERNRAVRRAIRTQCKKVREAVAAGDAPKAESELRLATVRLDRAASRGTIHANSAARTKSRLSAAIKALKVAKK
jgi:small subunit ribosomal protein S20